MNRIGRRLGGVVRFVQSPLVKASCSGLGFFLWERRWLAVALLVGATIAVVPPPAGLSSKAWITLSLAAISVILLIAEPIPLPAVALLMIVGQVALLGLAPDVVAASLLSDAVLFVLGSLLLSVAVVKRRMDRRLAFGALSLVGTHPLSVTVAFSAAAVFTTVTLGEHAGAAMLMPAAIALIRAAATGADLTRRLSATLLMSIAFSCAIAAIATPSGAVRNAMLFDYWRYSGSGSAVTNYATWTLYCMPIALAQLPALILVLHTRYRPTGADFSEARRALGQQLIEQGPMSRGDWATLLVLAATIAGYFVISDVLGLGIVALLGVATMLGLGLVRWLDLNAGVNWGVVLLYAASLSLGAQLIETGAATWLGTGLLAGFGHHGSDGSHALLWGVMATAMAGAASAMSSGSSVAFITPVNLEFAAAVGADPTIAGLVSVVASSFAYLTVIGAPACAIVYASGYLRAREMLIVGILVYPVSLAVLVFAALFYWPLLGLR